MDVVKVAFEDVEDVEKVCAGGGGGGGVVVVRVVVEEVEEMEGVEELEDFESALRTGGEGVWVGSTVDEDDFDVVEELVEDDGVVEVVEGFFARGVGVVIEDEEVVVFLVVATGVGFEVVVDDLTEVVDVAFDVVLVEDFGVGVAFAV